MDREPPSWTTEDAGLDDLDRDYARDAGAKPPNGSGGPKSGSAAAPLAYTLLADIVPNLGEQWIVKDLIPRAGLGVAYGQPGAGKSAIILDLALHGAAGRPYRGRRVEPQPVVYVVLEGHGSAFNRVVAARDRLEIRAAPFALVKAAENYRDPVAAERTAAVARELLAHHGGDCALIIIDTFQAALGAGGSDCAPEDVGAFIEAVKQHLVLQNMTVLVIHHAGKDQSRGARGWSGLNAAIDFELEVGRDDDLRTMGVSKMRDGPDAQPAMCFKLRPWTLGTNRHGEPVTTVVTDHHADAGGTARSKRLSPGARAALEKLWEMIKSSSQSFPLDGGPLRCVMAGQWFTECAEHGVVSGDHEPRNRRAKTKKAINELVEAGKVILQGEDVDDLTKCRAYPTPKAD